MKNYYSKHYHQWLKPECQNNKNSFCLPLKLAVFNSPQIVFPTLAGVGRDSYLCSTYLWVHVGSKMTDRVINRKVSDRKPKKRTGKKKIDLFKKSARQEERTRQTKNLFSNGLNYD